MNLRMPFDLRNAAQIFQRLIDEVVKELPFDFAYIDDVLIYSHVPQKHYEHLREVFGRQGPIGLTININKCDLAVSKLSFLGRIIDVHGITLVPEKVAAMQQFPQQTSLR